jgi:hypothetical protein
VFLFWLAASFHYARYFAGGSPAAGYLLLRGQKKLTEEKAVPVSRACASLALLDEFWVCGTRSNLEKTHKRLRAQTSPRPHHRTRLRYSAAHKGFIGKQRHNDIGSTVFEF